MNSNIRAVMYTQPPKTPNCSITEQSNGKTRRSVRSASSWIRHIKDIVKEAKERDCIWGYPYSSAKVIYSQSLGELMIISGYRILYRCRIDLDDHGMLVRTFKDIMRQPCCLTGLGVEIARILPTLVWRYREKEAASKLYWRLRDVLMGGTQMLS